MNIARTIAKNSLFNFIGTASDLLVGFVVGIVLTRSLGTEQYGIYSYLMWFLSLVAVIIDLGATQMAKRFVAEALGAGNTYEAKGFVRLTLMLRGGAALFVSLMILGSSRYWTSLSGIPGNQIYFVIIAFAVLPHGLNYALISIFAGFQKFDYGAYVTLGTGPLRLVLIIVLIALGFGVRELLILHTAILVLGVVVGLILLHRLIPLKELFPRSLLNTATKKRALQYALTWAGILGVDYLAYNQAAVFFIGLYCPVDEVGFYNLATRMSSMLMALLPSVLAAVLLPAIAEQFGKGDMGKIRTIYLASARYLMMVALPLAAGGIALTSPIITLLYGVDYAPAIILMQIVILPLAIFNIGHAAGAVIFGINRPGFILKVNIILALVTIGLSLWLIPRYGVLGAAVAGSVPQVLNVALGINFVSRKIGATWPWRDALKITLASSIMGLAVYALQGRLGVVLSVGVGIPLGVVIYVLAILVFREIRNQDLVLLKGIENSLPLLLRKCYAPLIRLVERIMVRTKLVTTE
jgi:O-antigen/teichoic acid export membrane protein